MTLIGIWTECDRAFIWADTESYRKDEEDRCPRLNGHSLKITINERAEVAAVGAGTLFGNKLIGEATMFANSFDHLIEGLPRYLNSAVRDWELDYVPNWICAAAGWSRRFGRMMGAVLRNTSGEYRAAITPHYAMPELPEFMMLHPTAPADILGYGQSQMRRVQQYIPIAGAGMVMIAEIRRHNVAVTSFDLMTGRASQSLPNLPPMNSAKTAPSFAGELA